MTFPQQPEQPEQHDGTNPEHTQPQPTHSSQPGSLGNQYAAPGAQQHYAPPEGQPYGGPSSYGQQPGQQQPYAAAYGDPASVAPPAASDPRLSTRGFFGRLFDLSFTSYITPSIVTIVYILAIVVVVFGWLVSSIVAFQASAALGFITLIILGPIYAFFVLVLIRITLEFYVAVIHIAEDIKALRERTSTPK